ERRGLERARGRPAGVDDQDVEAAEPGDRLLDCRLGLARLAHVGRLPAGRLDLLRRRLDPRFAPGRDEDLRTLVGQGLGAAEAKPLAGGGDEGAAALQPEVHALNSRAPPYRPSAAAPAPRLAPNRPAVARRAECGV